MEKMKLKLTAKEMHDFGAILAYIITSVDVRELKSDRHVDYLMFALLSDPVDRIARKTTDFARFGSPVPQNRIGAAKPATLSVSLKRHEAIALFLVLNETDGYLPSLDPLTLNMIMGIRAQIHQTFMI